MLIQKLNLNQISKNPNTSRFEFPTPRLGENSKGTEFILENFRKKVDNKNLVNDIKITSNELISNASFHGNHLDSNKFIKIYCLWIKNKFYFVFKDEGNGFDILRPPKNGPSPPEGGLGLIYSKERVDKLYNFKDSCAYACKKLSKQKHPITNKAKIKHSKTSKLI